MSHTYVHQSGFSNIWIQTWLELVVVQLQSIGASSNDYFHGEVFLDYPFYYYIFIYFVYFIYCVYFTSNYFYCLIFCPLIINWPILADKADSLAFGVLDSY